MRSLIRKKERPKKWKSTNEDSIEEGTEENGGTEADTEENTRTRSNSRRVRPVNYKTLRRTENHYSQLRTTIKNKKTKTKIKMPDIFRKIKEMAMLQLKEPLDYEQTNARCGIQKYG